MLTERSEAFRTSWESGMKEGDVRRIAEQPGTGAAPAERLLAPPPPRPLRALHAEGDARVWPYT